MAILAAIRAYLGGNLVGISIRVLPVMLFAGVFGVQWYMCTSLQRAGWLVVAVTAVVAGLDIAGKLPTVGSVDKVTTTSIENASKS
jgi:hypothetical protein